MLVCVCVCILFLQNKLVKKGIKKVAAKHFDTEEHFNY